MTSAAGLRVLVVDDEAPAADEVAWLLRQDPRIAEVITATDGPEALRKLTGTDVDAVFLDIRMPGLDGLDVARVLGRFPDPPAIVFVTADDSHGVAAFDLRAVDYLVKPVRPDRIAEAVNRVSARRITATDTTRETGETATGKIAVELGGVTRFVAIGDVRYVEAHGDYARLVTATGRPLVRVPLSVLEEQWAGYGFVRIHRSWLVQVAAIDEVRHDSGRMSLVVGADVLEVSRRHTRALRDRLVRAARPGR